MKLLEWIGVLTKRPALAAMVCLALIVCFHSPRWWIIAHESPGTFEWDRALSYMHQCASPFDNNVEPAMRWRFVPQFLIWLCHGGRGLALLIPWLGVWALLTYLFVLAEKSGQSPVDRFATAITLGATAPILVSTGWLGVNDAWVALGLCYFAFGRSVPLLIATSLLCPFIDERFIFGVPGAAVIRHWELLRGDFWPGFRRVAVLTLAGVTPFIAARLLGKFGGRNDTLYEQFLLQSIKGSSTYLWMAPLGFWMALRFAMVPLAFRILAGFQEAKAATILLVGAAMVPVGVGFLLATDTMRTTGILLPVCAWAMVAPDQNHKATSWRWLAVANLLVPAAHVTFTKIAAINSLPVELWRLLR